MRDGLVSMVFVLLLNSRTKSSINDETTEHLAHPARNEVSPLFDDNR